MLFKVIGFFPQMLRDVFFRFDVLLVVIGFADNCILRFMGTQKVITDVLRICSLLRLLRMARLLHLIRPLHTIVAGFFTSAKLIFWSIIMLTGIIYMAAIAMVDLVGHSPEVIADPDVCRYWCKLGDAMMTLMSMATYSEWGLRISEVGNMGFPWMYGFGLAFMSLAALGILNLVTGMMVQAAFHIVMKEGALRENVRISAVRIVLDDCIEMTFKKVHKMQKTYQEALRRSILKLEEVRLKEKKEGEIEAKQRLLEERASKKKGKNDAGGASMMRLQNALLEQMHLTDKEEEEEDEDEKHKGPALIASSVHDHDNICNIVAAIWLTNEDLAFIVEEKADGSLLEAQKIDGLTATLIWEGGQSLASLKLFDADAHAKTIISFQENKGKVQALTFSSILIFSQVRRKGTHIKFRYANGYSPCYISPNDLPRDAHGEVDDEIRRVVGDRQGPGGNKMLNTDANESLLRMLLRNLGYKVDSTRITEVEMDIVLQDAALNKRLASVNLRPDQVLMTWSAMDVTQNGWVLVEDLIESIIRLKRPVLGIDVARAKSVMRRMLMEFTHLDEEATGCFTCCSHVVQVLRDVQITKDLQKEKTAQEEKQEENQEEKVAPAGGIELTPRMPGDDSHVDALLLHRRALESNNSKLELQVARLRRYVNAEREKMGLNLTDNIFTINKYESEDEEEDLGEDHAEIASADEGWE